MAALQKIRSSSWIIGLMGVGMFLFILTMVLDQNTLSVLRNSSNNAGSVYGNSLSQQEFYEMVNEASEVAKLTSGGSLSDEQTDQIRDKVWNDYVQYELVKHETDKLGLEVTDKEVEQAIKEGTAQAFQNVPMFMQPTGRFDYTALQNFLKQAKAMQGQQTNPEVAQQIATINKLWAYTEKQLRRELLMVKYQTAFMRSFTTNPVAAKMEYDARSMASTAEVASFPYATLPQKDLKITDEDLKTAYKANKELFRMDQESRNIKYIDVEVTASEADRKALDTKMQELYQKMQAAGDLATLVNSSKSVMHYVDIPLSDNLFPADVKAELEKMTPGQLNAPQYNAQDNTINIVKLVNKSQSPDSILYRAIPVQAADATAATTRADSMIKALNSGASFAELAKKAGVPSDSVWVNAQQFENPQLSGDNLKFVQTLLSAPLKQYAVMEMQGMKVVLQVLDRKAMKTKYTAAVVKVPVDFSKATYDAAVSKMNRFLAANHTLADLVKNAPKEGYRVVDQNNFTTSQRNIGADGYNPGVRGSKDAVKWVFDEAKEGEVSSLYQVGEANNHLLVVGLSKVNDDDYYAWDSKEVKDYLTLLVKREKLAQMAEQKYAGIKSVAQAKAKGAVVEKVENLTFAGQTSATAVGVNEPKLAGAIAATKKGATTPMVFGAGGAYIARVIDRKNISTEKFDAKAVMQQQQQGMMQALGQATFFVLRHNAKIQDNRYKF